VLVNDTGAAVTDLPVTLKIMNGDTVLYAERITMSVDAFSKDSKGLSTETLTVTVPAFRDYCNNRQVLTVTASYELNGETVTSQRKWTVQGGDFTDGPLPTYDWLEQEEETETDPVETATDPAESDPADTEPSAPADTEEQGTTSEPETTPAKKGCGSTVSATALLISAGCALVLSKKREKFPC
jgi:hypothetical protein